jgi:NADPH:quinone reductase-like Zn-dependent oxidoreductase
VAAAGVGPWDSLIREHKSVVNVPLPLTLGSDLSGLIEEIGLGVSAFKTGDEVYGVTNPDFCGRTRSTLSPLPQWSLGSRKA